MNRLDFDQAMGVLATTMGDSINLQFKRKVETKNNDPANLLKKKSRSKKSKSGPGNGRGRKGKKHVKQPSITQQMLESLDIMCGGNGGIETKDERRAPCGGLFQVARSEVSWTEEKHWIEKTGRCWSYDGNISYVSRIYDMRPFNTAIGHNDITPVC